MTDVGCDEPSSGFRQCKSSFCQYNRSSKKLWFVKRRVRILPVTFVNLTIVSAFQSICLHEQSYKIQLPLLPTILSVDFKKSITYALC